MKVTLVAAGVSLTSILFFLSWYSFMLNHFGSVGGASPHSFTILRVVFAVMAILAFIVFIFGGNLSITISTLAMLLAPGLILTISDVLNIQIQWMDRVGRLALSHILLSIIIAASFVLARYLLTLGIHR